MLVLIIIVILVLLYVIGNSWTYRVQSAPEQAEFLQGKIPHSEPDGFYAGSVNFLQPIWLGKEFNAGKHSGINHWRQGKNSVKRFSFKTSVTKGLLDIDKEVIRLDYNLPANPFWMRMVVDEIVETSPQQFLGKVHIKLPLGIVFSLGYFRLAK